MKETAIVFHSLLVVFLLASTHAPWITVLADKRTSSSVLSSSGYHDPYKFAYAVKKPLPFRSSFGENLVPGKASSSTDLRTVPNLTDSELLDTSSSLNSPQHSSLVSNSVENAISNKVPTTSVDASYSFGDRIVPRRVTGNQQKKVSSSAEASPPFQPTKDKKQEDGTSQEFQQFFARVPESQPSTEPPVQKKSRVKTSPKPKIEDVTVHEPIVDYQSAENSNSGGQEAAESIQTQYFPPPSVPLPPPPSSTLPTPLPSTLPSQVNSQDSINFQTNNNYRADPYQNVESAYPGLSYSYLVLGSSTTPEKFTSLTSPSTLSIENQLVSQEVGSPASVFSSIDQIYDQYSPFPQPESFRNPSYFPPESSAQGPVRTQKPPVADIATLIQPVTLDPPAFVPSPPVITDQENQSFLIKYPEPPRVLEPPTIVSSSIDESTLKSALPAANNYAGFIPSTVNGVSDTFSEFPKPNFATFYPEKSTETIYFGGNPNEPPSLLKTSVISFIKTNAANALQPPREPKFPSADTFNIKPPSVVPYFGDDNRFTNNQFNPYPVPPKVNPQPIRPPISNLQVIPSSVTKNSYPSAPKPSAPKPSTPVTSTNVKPTPVTNVTPPSTSLTIPPVQNWSAPLPAKNPVKNVPTPSKPIFIPGPAVQQPSYTPSLPKPATPSKQVLTVPKPSYFNLPPPIVSKSPNPNTQLKGTAPIRFSNPVVQQNGWIPKLVAGSKRPDQGVSLKPALVAGTYNSIQPVRPVTIPAPTSTQGFKPSRPTAPAYSVKSVPLSFKTPSVSSLLSSFKKSQPASIPMLVPYPVYLTPSSLTIPLPSSHGSSSSYSVPRAQPLNYHAVVSYG